MAIFPKSFLVIKEQMSGRRYLLTELGNVIIPMSMIK